MTANAMLKSAAQLAVIALFTVAAVIGLFIAWWIAVFAVLGLAAYVLVRRVFGKPAAQGGAVVIDGEYRVHAEPDPAQGEPRLEQHSTDDRL